MTGLVIFRDALFDELLPRDVVGDEIREQRGEVGIETVRVEKTELEDEGMTFALHDERRLSPEDERTIQDIYNNRAWPIIEPARVGYLSPGKATWKIHLRGQRNQGLRILNIEVIEIEKGPPLAGTLFWIPPQGGEESEVMGINLDELNPIVRAAKITGSGVQFEGQYFPGKTISLDDKEEIVIVLRTVTRKNTVSFKLRLDYQVGDLRKSTEIEDNGNPFRLTAYNCRDGRLDYKSFYSLGGGGNGTTYGIYPGPPEGSSNFCRG